VRSVEISLMKPTLHALAVYKIDAQNLLLHVSALHGCRYMEKILCMCCLYTQWM